MNSKEILSRAAASIEKHGLARKMAYDKTTQAYCLGAAVVEGAYAGYPRKLLEKDYRTDQEKKFLINVEKEYAQARNLLCGRLGISSSYDALVDYNDDSFVTKKGELRYKHSPTDVLKEIREVIATLS